MPERGRDDVENEDKEDGRCCQGKLCASVKTEKNLAGKVCHHEDCQEINNGNPLVLCLKCDEAHHLGVTAAHARFDIPERPRGSIIKALPKHLTGSDNDSGNEDDVDSHADKKTTRGYSSGKRMFKLSAGAKKKPRRHNTDDPTRECFSVRFHDNNTPEVEIMPALQGKSLKESLESLFEKRSLSFCTHSVFLDSSNTPLPLAFDTFPLGGNVLHVRANRDVYIDQRVVDVTRAQGKGCEEPMGRPKSGSFMGRSGSFNARKQGNQKKCQEQDEKEKEKELREKADKMLSQQLKNSQRGKKNMLSFLGDDPAMSSSVSSPVLPGGSVTSSTGTLHRPRSASKLTGLFNPPKQTKEFGSTKSIPLKDLLDVYTVYGLEYNGNSEQTEDDPDEDIKLENSWMDVVDDSIREQMTKKERDQQEAIWELLSTEVSYLEKLQVLIKVYILCLTKLQMEGYLQEVEISKLFSNVEDIYEVNLSFWLDCLSQVAQISRKTRKPLNPSDMTDGFPMFDTRFEPYIRYCMEEANCLKYLKEKSLESEEFRQYITWCEEHRLCTDRLKLNDLLVKPMQRVTKYGLLLKAILSKTQDMDTKEQIKRMMSKVESFVTKVDGAMRKLHEQQRLIAVADRITNNYNVVEAVNEEMERLLQDYSSMKLTGTMPGLGTHRCVIHEGPLRLVEKQGKMDVHVFLFTDLLLITKAKKGDKCRVIKSPIQVEKLAVHKSKDAGTFLLISLNDYNTVTHAFALQGSVADENQWLESIREAQKRYAVEKMSQGSGNLFQTSEESFSPTSFVGTTPLGMSPAGFRFQRRASSASSILSMDSDSDEESAQNEQQANNLPRARSESVLTSASSGAHSWLKEKDREPAEGRYQVPDERTSPEMASPPDELLGAVGGVRLHSDSLKVSRSSSAPQHERPRVESALSRSSSDPLGPKHNRNLKEGLIIKRRTLEEDISITSSSISLEDSDNSFQTSVDFPSLPLRETQSVSNDLEPSSPQSDVVDPPPAALDACENARRGSSPTESEPSSPCELDGISIVEDGDGAESETSQESQDSVKPSRNRHTPHIKSPLIAQQKLNSAIYTSTEATQRKRIGLPRRSSPVMSRKPNPEDLVRSHNAEAEERVTKEQEIAEIMEKIRGVPKEGTRSLPAKLVSRHSEPSRAPVKPDRSLGAAEEEEEAVRDASFNTGRCKETRRTLPSRKKSMSLSDLLNLGRELTSGRSDKTKEKERNRENQEADDSHTDDGEGDKKHRKKTKEEPEDKRRRFKIRRRKSQRVEIKDGIASGPSMDKRKATKLFLKESLLLESSKSRLQTSRESKAKYIFN